ncbi:MAG: hypothetical protein L0G59_12855, partial [Kocuria sp.]|nr:hypothetical protein [Kocuria sp.]
AKLIGTGAVPDGISPTVFRRPAIVDYGGSFLPRLGMPFNYAVFPGFRASPGSRNVPHVSPGRDAIGSRHETRCLGLVDDALPEQVPFESPHGRVPEEFDAAASGPELIRECPRSN